MYKSLTHRIVKVKHKNLQLIYKKGEKQNKDLMENL